LKLSTLKPLYLFQRMNHVVPFIQSDTADQIR